MINGQAFGNVAGGARLSSEWHGLPIELLEWTPSRRESSDAATSDHRGHSRRIEVFRGDGSLASKTPIDLTAQAAPLAWDAKLNLDELPPRQRGGV